MMQYIKWYMELGCIIQVKNYSKLYHLDSKIKKGFVQKSKYN